MENFSFYSYLIGFLVFFLLLIIAIRRVRKNRFVPAFIIAVTTSVVWMAYVAYVFTQPSLYIADTFIFETVRNATWFFFLTILISRNDFSGSYLFLIKSKLVILCCLWLVIVCAIEISPTILDIGIHFIGQDIRLFAHLGFSIIGLILLEELYQSVDRDQRWAIRYLCLGLGAIFAFDFIIYSKSLLFGRLDFVLWNVRGLINALCVPLLAISFGRLQDDEQQVTISRTAVAHTTVLFGTGIYMILMSLAGFYVKNFSGSWGEVLQAFFVFLAIFFVIFVFATGKIRAYLKVYFNTHFFQHRYDYREEWIKLSRGLASRQSLDHSAHFVIKTLMDLAGCKGGGIWLRNDSGAFYLSDEESLGFCFDTVLPKGDPFITFLNETQWVIDFYEYKENPEIYDAVDLSLWLDYKQIWLIIPLLQQGKVIAFTVLTRSFVMRQLSHEDHDLLKTVGLQLANALVLSEVTEDLSRARQFEAYSRFSAFLVHDLKNLVAQVSMIVRNAEQHKSNPEFIDDAVGTLENVVDKMEHLLTQLKKGQTKTEGTALLNILDVLLDVVLQQAGNLPKVSFECALKECLILGNKQQFVAILGHLVQNAQDATPDDGVVKIIVNTDQSNVLIDITDTGSGMDQKFIHERLFKPFDTTKGNAGMGVGVYEAREYILNHGGNIAVTSHLGVGTTFNLKYPLLKK